MFCALVALDLLLPEPLVEERGHLVHQAGLRRLGRSRRQRGPRGHLTIDAGHFRIKRGGGGHGRAA